MHGFDLPSRDAMRARVPGCGPVSPPGYGPRQRAAWARSSGPPQARSAWPQVRASAPPWARSQDARRPKPVRTAIADIASRIALIGPLAQPAEDRGGRLGQQRRLPRIVVRGALDDAKRLVG